MKYHFKADNHMQACVVFPLNSFGSTNLMFICSQMLIFINGACTSVITRVAVVYMGIE